jgi:hypothetical protein
MIRDLWRETFVRQEVPETSIAIYKNYLRELGNISAVAKAMDNSKFSDREFINFVKINAAVNNDQGEYEGLKNSINLLRVALETEECFLKIEATETRYHGYSQQEFYDYVMELLEKQVGKNEFKELVQKKLTTVMAKTKTKEGQAALQSYINQLDILAKDELGLRLLYLFKKNDLSSLSLLRKVAEIADTFYDKDLNFLKEFTGIVQVQLQIFLKLGEIIKLPRAKNVPSTSALILQYIALRNRHQKSLARFQQLISLLQDWLKFYAPIVGIISEYPASKYKQPPIFAQDIPGLDLYNKYQEFIK